MMAPSDGEPSQGAATVGCMKTAEPQPGATLTLPSGTRYGRPEKITVSPMDVTVETVMDMAGSGHRRIGFTSPDGQRHTCDLPTGW